MALEQVLLFLLIGGWVFTRLGIAAGGILGGLVVATFGAIILLLILSLFRKAR